MSDNGGVSQEEHEKVKSELAHYKLRAVFSDRQDFYDILIAVSDIAIYGLQPLVIPIFDIENMNVEFRVFFDYQMGNGESVRLDYGDVVPWLDDKLEAYIDERLKAGLGMPECAKSTPEQQAEWEEYVDITSEAMDVSRNPETGELDEDKFKAYLKAHRKQN